jgi:phage shock protein PspC (stress-responsive transcriptional regulator)
MKRTNRINISGLVFNIDEDAYEALDLYINQIKSRFADLDEANEIVGDIEQRISELFHERLNDSKEIITIEDVQSVIDIMGKPSDYGDEPEYDSEPKVKRRMYRDTENALISGVGSGLAAYFSADVSIVRLIIVILSLISLGTGLLVYGLLWVIIPAAETPAQKLEMKGKVVNIGNIQKNISERVNKIDNSGVINKIGYALGQIVHALGKIIYIILRIVLVCIGIAFVLAGIGILFGLFIGLFVQSSGFFGDMFIWDEISRRLILHVAPVSTILSMCIAGFVGILIPSIFLIYAGIKIIFKLKSKDKAFVLSGIAVWFVSVLVFGITIGIVALNFTHNDRVIDRHKLSSDSDTIYIKGNSISDYRTLSRDRSVNFEGANIYTDMYGEELFVEPELHIYKGDKDFIEIELYKESQGSNKMDAIDNVSSIKYNYELKGDTLHLDKLFKIGDGAKWRAQEIDIIVYIPEGKYFNIDSNTYSILDYSWILSRVYSYNMSEKTYVMGEDKVEESK